MANRSLNKVTLIGNLTRDPELKYTPSGAAVCTIGIATNRTWTSNDGQAKEEVQYHRIIAWNKLAELCGKLLTKGRKIYAEGRLSYRSYTAKDGTQKNITEIILEDFILFNDGRGPVGDTQDDKEESSKAQAKKDNTPEHDEKSEEREEGAEDEAQNNSKSNEDESVNPDDIPF